MAELTLAHTSMLAPDALAAVRAMVKDAFGGELSARGWDHALGGVHCIAWEGGAPVAHAAVVARRLVHGGRALRTGYVEGVAVTPAHRRQGLGNAVMEAAEGVITSAYEVGALSTTDMAASLYAARGWSVWEGPLSVLTPDGPRPTPEEAGGVYVLDPSGLLHTAGALACDWRDGEVW